MRYKECRCRPEFYLFLPQDVNKHNEYNNFFKISVAMGLNGDPAPGIVTTHDDFAISWTKPEVAKKIRLLLNTQDETEARKTFKLCTQNQWIYSRAKSELSDNSWKKDVVHILYRPFDTRWTAYNRNVAVHRRKRVMHHMLAGENLGLITCRQRSQKEGIWSSVGISNIIIESCAISNKTKEINYLFPLYLYSVDGELNFTKGIWPAGKNGRTPNLDPKFVVQLADEIRLEFVSDGKGDLEKTFGPEDIFNYIYGIFHSPTYRSRYAEFLKIDFPRVPITNDGNMFKTLCNLGGELVALHLMESDKLNKHITTFPVQGDNAVAKVGEKGKTLADVKNGKGKLFINKTQYFDNLPEEVWNFHIGGYQVCYKWLYDRKKAGRKLSAEDIDHYHKIVVVLSETIKLMAEIDKTIEAHTGWPGAFTRR